MIWIHELNKSFEAGKEIFSGVNLLIPSGVSVGILGDPGSGKSTLLNLIAGSELPTEGKVTLDGSLLWAGSISSAMHGQMTLQQSLRFLGRLYTEDDRTMETMIGEILSLAGLSEKRHKLWSEIQSKEKQALKFAALTVIETDHLLIDGPLSPKGDERLAEKIKEKIRKTTTVLISSLRNMREICEAGIVIHEKKLHYFDAFDEALKFYESVSKR